MDFTRRLSPVIITTPAEKATFFNLNISSFPKQIPAQLPSGRILKRKVLEFSEDDDFMKKRLRINTTCFYGSTEPRSRK